MTKNIAKKGRDGFSVKPTKLLSVKTIDPGYHRVSLGDPWVRQISTNRRDANPVGCMKVSVKRDIPVNACGYALGALRPGARWSRACSVPICELCNLGNSIELILAVTR